MPDFSTRSSQIEIMDDLQCAGEVVDQTLVELEFINKWLGGNAVTRNGLNFLLSKQKLPRPVKSRMAVADLGCGGGDMLKLLAPAFRQKKINVELTGIDANPNIIFFAKKNAHPFSEINFQTLDVLSDMFRQQRYDIIFATLFFHHFSSSQLIEVFSHLKKQAKIGIVINDLHRHWLAYYSIKLLTKLFSRSSMVRFDAPLSVLRGFKKNELEEILSQAGIKDYSLQWKWAFRWQLIIYC
jgi:2-polyprenyl-3-methyl-5-hydroxy-6-metoxy-1,4-benzoquinol methylase